METLGKGKGTFTTKAFLGGKGIGEEAEESSLEIFIGIGFAKQSFVKRFPGIQHVMCVRNFNLLIIFYGENCAT